MALLKAVDGHSRFAIRLRSINYQMKVARFPAYRRPGRFRLRREHRRCRCCSSHVEHMAATSPTTHHNVVLIGGPGTGKYPSVRPRLEVQRHHASTICTVRCFSRRIELVNALEQEKRQCQARLSEWRNRLVDARPGLSLDEHRGSGCHFLKLYAVAVIVSSARQALRTQPASCITTNHSASRRRWAKVFGVDSAKLTGRFAACSRLTHHCHDCVRTRATTATDSKHSLVCSTNPSKQWRKTRKLGRSCS